MVLIAHLGRSLTCHYLLKLHFLCLKSREEERWKFCPCSLNYKFFKSRHVTDCTNSPYWSQYKLIKCYLGELV